MTKLEALQAMVEYQNTNLFTKVLLDAGITPDDAYTAANEGEIDLAAAEIYRVLEGAPDIKEGGLAISLPPERCRAARNQILAKYGLLAADITSEEIW